MGPGVDPATSRRWVSERRARRSHGARGAGRRSDGASAAPRGYSTSSTLVGRMVRSFASSPKRIRIIFAVAPTTMPRP